MTSRIFISILFLIISNGLFAQIELDSVVITANKFEQKLDQTGKHTTIITKEEIQNNIGLTVSELLQKQPGILINGSGQTLGSNQSIYLQGSDAGQTLILINGTPIQDPSNIEGNFDLNLISLLDIERIEIIKGGQSTLYGSNATAGVINFITKNEAKKGQSYNVYLGGGSFQTLSSGFGMSFVSDISRLNLGFSSIFSKGFSSAKDTTNSNNFDKDGFKRAGFNFSYSTKLKLLKFKLDGRWYAIASDLDWGAFTDDKSYSSKSDNIVMTTGLTYPLKKGEIKFNYRINGIKRNYLKDSTFVNLDPFSPKYSEAKYNSIANYLETFLYFTIRPQLNLLAGIDFSNQRLNQTYFSISEYGQYEDTPLLFDKTKVNNLSIYLNSSYKKSNGLGLETGLRYNYNSYYHSFLSYNINPYFIVNENFKIYSIISNSYKNPSLYQLYSPYGNKELKPEKGNDFRIGLNFSKKSYGFSFEFFNKLLNQKFYFKNLADFPYGQYINLNKVKINGIELNGNYSFNRIYLSGNYTFMSPDNYKNYLRRPKNQLNLNFTFNFSEKFQASASSSFIGKRFDQYYSDGKNTTVNLGSVFLLNANFNYQFLNKLSLFFNLQNILNSKYYEIYGFNSKPINFNFGIVLK